MQKNMGLVSGVKNMKIVTEKYICDRCGREGEDYTFNTSKKGEEYGFARIKTSGLIGVNDAGYIDIEGDYEICFSCYDEFKKYIKNGGKNGS